MKKFLKIISVLCAVALLAGCSLISDVSENEATPSKGNSPKVITVNGVDYNLERFNIYYYSAQDEILSGAGLSQAESIPKDFWEQKVDGKTNLERAKEKAVEMLVADALAYEKAKELGIKITAEEKSNLENTMAQIRQTPTSYEQLSIMGVSEEEMMKYWEEQMCMSHLLPKLIEKGELKVDEATAQQKFDETYIKAKHILISTVDAAGQPLPEADAKKAEEKAKEILAKVKAGEDFDTLMNENSTDPGLETAPDGYVFKSGEMVPEFEEAAFNLGIDQVSEIVPTSYGYHIIKRVAPDMKGEQEELAMQGIKSEIVYPDYEVLAKKWKDSAKIKKEDKIIKDLKPTIIKN